MEKVEGDYDRLKPLANKINENRKKLEKGLNTIHILQDMCSDTNQKFQEFYEIINNLDKKKILSDLLQVINTQHSKNLQNKDERRLFYNYTFEVKFEKWEDWIPIYNRIKKETVKEIEIQQVELKKSVTMKKSRQSVMLKYEAVDTNHRKAEFSMDKLSKGDVHSEESISSKEENKDTSEIIKNLQVQNKMLIERVNKLEKEINVIKKEEETPLTVDIVSPMKSWNLCLIKSFSLQDSTTYAKSFCINPAMDLLIIGLKNGNLEIYQMNSWTYLFTLTGHKNSVKTICYLNDGKSIISGGKDGKLIKWDLIRRQALPFNNVLNSSIKSIVYDMNNNNIYAACLKKVYCFDIRTYDKKQNLTLTLKSNVTNLLWIKQNGFLVVGLDLGTIVVYDTEKLEIYFEIDVHKTKITHLSICESDIGLNFVSFSRDKTFKMFDVLEKKVVREFQVCDKTNHYARGGIYCGDRKTLVTFHDDGKIVLNNYSMESELGKHKNKYYFSTDNKILCGVYLGDGLNFVFGNNLGNIDIFFSK
jgi:WD40 repeat protein